MQNMGVSNANLCTKFDVKSGVNMWNFENYVWNADLGIIFFIYLFINYSQNNYLI